MHVTGYGDTKNMIEVSCLSVHENFGLFLCADVDDIKWSEEHNISGRCGKVYRKELALKIQRKFFIRFVWDELTERSKTLTCKQFIPKHGYSEVSEQPNMPMKTIRHGSSQIQIGTDQKMICRVTP